MANAKFWSGAAYVGLTIPLLCYSHTLALPLVLGAISARCIYEALNISQFEEARLIMAPALLLALLLPVSAVLHALLPVLLCYLFLLLCLLQYLIHYDHLALLHIVYCMFFPLLLGSCFLAPLYVRRLPDGLWLLVLTFLGTWSADTCAQFCGKLFGKHKLGIGVSPNKTVEGCIGSLACTALACVAFGALCNRWTTAQFSLPLMALCGLCISVAGQIGDLLASAVKRQFQVKDFSRLIPGHGGMYDRFDSFALVGPMVYLLARILLQKG